MATESTYSSYNIQAIFHFSTTTNISFIQNQVTMYDHLPCTHTAGSGIWKIPFFGFKNIFSHVLEVAPNITAMVNLLLKSPKKSNGLKGNHMNISKTAAPK